MAVRDAAISWTLNSKDMDTLGILTISQIKGVGPAYIKKHLAGISAAGGHRSYIEMNHPEAMDMVPAYEAKAEVILQDCCRLGITVVDCLSESYPRQLLEIADPPAVFYMKGNTDLLRTMIAIIGTRHSTRLGNRIAERLGEYFSGHFAICNGLVEGIDEHSVRLGGKMTGRAVGIISGGLDYQNTCSARHREVIDDVLQAGGLVMTEYPPRQPEDRFSGSKASRIQAGLSQGLILVQSKADGGSKYTLKTYARLSRPLGVISYPGSEEFSEETFEANRMILEERTSGLARMTGLKEDKIACTIQPIESKADYRIFERKVTESAGTHLLL